MEFLISDYFGLSLFILNCTYFFNNFIEIYKYIVDEKVIKNLIYIESYGMSLNFANSIKSYDKVS